MKKYLSMFLALSITLTMTGCGSVKTNKNGVPNQSTSVIKTNQSGVTVSNQNANLVETYKVMDAEHEIKDNDYELELYGYGEVDIDEWDLEIQEDVTLDEMILEEYSDGNYLLIVPSKDWVSIDYSVDSKSKKKLNTIVKSTSKPTTKPKTTSKPKMTSKSTIKASATPTIKPKATSKNKVKPSATPKPKVTTVPPSVSKPKTTTGKGKITKRSSSTAKPKSKKK